MNLHAQGLSSAIMQMAYKQEKSVFKQSVKCVPISSDPPDTNILSSHVIYKVKLCDVDTLQMKVCIDSHGNKDIERYELKKDSATCSPTGICIILSISRIFKWSLVKIDFKTAFLQTWKALRDVYVITLYESRNRQFYCFFGPYICIW